MCRAVCRAPPCSPVPPQKHFLSTSETPFSSYSAFVIQKASLSFMMSASTEPPKKTMCLRRGGSSIRNLSFADCSGWRDRANQRHSEPIRGTPSQSEAIRGTQRQSEAIRDNQSQSEALRATPRRSEAQSEALREAVGGQARTCSGERGGESKWGGQSACMHTHLLLVALAI